MREPVTFEEWMETLVLGFEALPWRRSGKVPIDRSGTTIRAAACPPEVFIGR